MSRMSESEKRMARVSEETITAEMGRLTKILREHVSSLNSVALFL